MQPFDELQSLKDRAHKYRLHENLVFGSFKMMEITLEVKLCNLEVKLCNLDH